MQEIQEWQTNNKKFESDSTVLGNQEEQRKNNTLAAEQHFKFTNYHYTDYDEDLVYFNEHWHKYYLQNSLILQPMDRM